ncbi:MAG: hypothetical protein RM049_26720 [Nostoc sp. DedQUE04]|uniref:hypothetical protein n=1 Tax=Nostoc sp. DedQUE04 TaxID=3075390 RepID=UPI002AD38287|nr:hypothetical protein [Nostoc sp. DedQUE04]MDZ8138854.1 hypothetical protein [Nostoc sp. DedQUE04]
MMEKKISIQDCRSLLQIQSRDTMTEYLRLFDLLGCRFISWKEFRRILELQAFLGLKPGCNSKAMFLDLSVADIQQMFAYHKIDITERFLQLQLQHERMNSVTLTVTLDND